MHADKPKHTTARVQILDLEFDPLTQSQVISRLEEVITARQRKRSLRYIKPYVTFFMSAQHDPTIRQAINGADLVIADGISAQWAASYLYANTRHSFGRWLKSIFLDMQNPDWLSRVIPERGAGVDVTHELLVHATQHGWRVGVLGGPRDNSAGEALSERYPMLQLGGVWSGYFEPAQEKRLMRQIQGARLDILFIAMGHPKQELFMARHAEAGLAKVLIGEGGTFDFDQMGGPIKRAPSWMRRIGLEWLWRVLIRPTNVWKVLAIPPFMWRVYLVRRSKNRR